MTTTLSRGQERSFKRLKDLSEGRKWWHRLLLNSDDRNNLGTVLRELRDSTEEAVRLAILLEKSNAELRLEQDRSKAYRAALDQAAAQLRALEVERDALVKLKQAITELNMRFSIDPASDVLESTVSGVRDPTPSLPTFQLTAENIAYVKGKKTTAEIPRKRQPSGLSGGTVVR